MKLIYSLIKRMFEDEKSKFEKTETDVEKSIHQRRAQMLLDIIVGLGTLYPEVSNLETPEDETDN